MTFKVGDIVAQPTWLQEHYKITEIKDGSIHRMVREKVERPTEYKGPFTFSMFVLVKPMMTPQEALYSKVAFLDKKAEALKLATLSKQADVPSVVPTVRTEQGTTSLSTATGTLSASPVVMAARLHLQEEWVSWAERYLAQPQIAGSHVLTNWALGE